MPACGVAKGHSHVSQVAPSLGALYGSPFEALIKFLRRDPHFLGQRLSRALSPKGRVTLHCKSIPGADHLANVASESPIADQRAQVGWDFVFEFDGEIRNAASGIESAVGEDALGGAGGDAACACATMISDHRKVWFESQVKQDLGKQKVGALFWINETGVFADPPNAGALGEITFKDGSG